MGQPAVPLAAVDAYSHAGLLTHVHIVPVLAVGTGAIEDRAGQGAFGRRREGEDVVLLLDVVAVPAPALGGRLVLGDGTCGASIDPLLLHLPVAGEGEHGCRCRRFDTVLALGAFGLGSGRDRIHGLHHHEEQTRFLGELVVVGIDIGPVVRAAEPEAEGVLLDRQFHVAGVILVHLVLARIHEFTRRRLPVLVDEADRVVHVVADPGAGTHGNLAIEMVQVDVRVPFLVDGRLEQAVPVLAVNAAVVDALSGGIAVGHNFLQGELQIVVILGVGAMALVHIPAPALRGRLHEGAAAPLGTGTAPYPAGGNGIAAQDGFRKRSHVDGIHAGLARCRCHGDGRSPTREIQLAAAIDGGSGLVGKLQGGNLHAGHVLHQVGRQLHLDGAGGFIHLGDLGQTGLSGKLDVQDLVVLVPAALLDLSPRVLGAGAQ